MGSRSFLRSCPFAYLRREKAARAVTAMAMTLVEMTLAAEMTTVAAAALLALGVVTAEYALFADFTSLNCSEVRD
jgi:hypothetical protein